MTEISVSNLAALVGGHFAAQNGFDPLLRGAAALGEAGPGHVTFYGNSRYLQALKRTQATAVLVPLDFNEQISALAIHVENPSAAFTRVVQHFAPPPRTFPPGVHPTAVLGEGVELGENVSIQPFVVIEAGAKIGAGTVIGAHGYVGHEVRIGGNCFLHPRVTVTERCILGDRVTVHSGAIIGSDGFGYEFSGGRHVKVPQVGVVEIDNDVEIGANATIDRARFGRTWIQEGTKIDNLVQIAHNVVVGKHCVLVAQVGISGSTRLGQYVTLAGQVGVAGHLEIEDQVVVGAQSGVSKSLTEPTVYMGYPAVPAQEWRAEVAHVHRLDRLVQRVKRLEARFGEQLSG